MRRFILLVGSCIVAVSPGHAGALLQTAPNAPAARPAPSESRALVPDQIDLARSRVFAYVGKGGLGHEHAVSGSVQRGEIHLGASRNAGTIVFDIASFTADLDEARRAVGLTGETSPSTREKVTANMRGGDVLDVQRYPTATFDIDSARAATNGQAQSYEFEGNFTLHGVKRPIRVLVRAEQVKDRIRLRGNFPIRQTDFGIEPYSTALGAIRVADELKIYGDIWIASQATSTLR